MAGLGGRGVLSQDEVRRGLVRFGLAVRRGGQGVVCLGKAGFGEVWRSRCVAERCGLARCGMAVKFMRGVAR